MEAASQDGSGGCEVFTSMHSYLSSTYYVWALDIEKWQRRWGGRIVRLRDHLHGEWEWAQGWRMGSGTRNSGWKGTGRSRLSLFVGGGVFVPLLWPQLFLSLQFQTMAPSFVLGILTWCLHCISTITCLQPSSSCSPPASASIPSLPQPQG